MKVKKKNFYALLAVVILILLGSLVALIMVYNLQKDPYQFKNDMMFYESDRENPGYNIHFQNKTDGINIYTVNYTTKKFLAYDTVIYGIVFVPESKTNVPGIILLPGGGVSKESEFLLAKKMASWGYAVITIDQRGIGETGKSGGGIYPGFEDDFRYFAQGYEPIQHLSVYDALRTYDVLKQIKGVDKKNIVVVGESMGGRYALIAAAEDKSLKGVIAISSSGFHIETPEATQASSYLRSIDPDVYIGQIAPRKVVMIHSTDDKMISVADANKTFELAREPKSLYIVNDCPHGYCDKMDDYMKKSLKDILGK